MNIQTPFAVTGESATYDRDFAAWLFAQAEAIRARHADGLDWENLAEEIESMGNSQRRELRSRLRVIMVHVLKLQLSVNREPRAGWMETIITQRADLDDLLTQSPSLRRLVDDYATEQFEEAHRLALAALALHEPSQIAAYRQMAESLEPESAETLLDRDWFPPPPK